MKTAPQSNDPPAAAENKERERLILKINLNRNRKNKASPTKPPLPDEGWLRIFSLLLQKDLTKDYEAFQKQQQEEESKERLRQKYRDEQSKKKEGKIKLISLQDLPPMPMKQHLVPVPKKKPEEAPKPMGMTSLKHAVPVKKRGNKIKNFLKKRPVHGPYRCSTNFLY